MAGNRHVIRGSLFLLLCLLGAATVYAGGADDSPGLQGIGVALVVIGVRAVVRAFRSPRDTRDHQQG